MRYFKILCVVLLASFLVACHQISSGTVVDKYIDEPHTTFIPVMNGKSSVLVPTRTKRKYNPSHYQGRYGMESIDALRNFMTDEQLKGFYLGNALKYLLRHQKKNGLEDLKKARKNLDWLIAELEAED